MSNIAKGRDRSGKGEFIQFLATAKGSADEVRSQLYVAWDQSYVSDRDFRELSLLAEETARIIGGLMKYLSSSDYSGTKYMTRTTRKS